MNTAIDQQCEKLFREQWTGGKGWSQAKLAERIYDEKGVATARRTGRTAQGNDGLGLMLLGLTGDQVVEPADVYKD
jgi:methylmalonyl-CoA mutase